MSKNIEKNMLRERAKNSDEITDEMWNKVNPFNRDKAEEFLLESTHLSTQSLKQYKSSLRIFYYWVYKHLNDKYLYQIKKKEFMKFQNYLHRNGQSSNTIKLRRSAVSSLNKYLINFYEEDEEFATFRNFVDGVPNPTPNKVYNKIPLTKEEFELILKTLEEKKKWQVLAAMHFLYASACRRSELTQILKNVVDSEPLKDKEGNPTNMYLTNEVRAKGKGEFGERRKLYFDDRALAAMNKWLEVRGEDDCPYLFVTNYRGEVNQVTTSTINYWCTEIISEIVERRVNPHLIRGTRSTHILEEGKDIKKAQNLLGHKQSSTTDQFYDLRQNKDDLSDIF